MAPLSTLLMHEYTSRYGESPPHTPWLHDEPWVLAFCALFQYCMEPDDPEASPEQLDLFPVSDEHGGHAQLYNAAAVVVHINTQEVPGATHCYL